MANVELMGKGKAEELSVSEQKPNFTFYGCGHNNRLREIADVGKVQWISWLARHGPNGVLAAALIILYWLGSELLTKGERLSTVAVLGVVCVALMIFVLSLVSIIFGRKHGENCKEQTGHEST